MTSEILMDRATVGDDLAVPAGYKRTEIGDLPSDWSVTSLGERAKFRTGPFGTALHKADYTSDGVPVINPMHIIDNELFPTQSMTVTEGAARKLSEFRLRDGDIVIGRRGDMGRCAMVKETQTGWLCGTGSLIVRCNQGFVPAFVQRVLSSPRAVAAITDASVGSTMTNLNQGILSNLKVQSPPEEEQRSIAATLSDVDGLIDALSKLIAKKRAIKLAAMQQVITGKVRQSGFNTKWSSRRLGEVLQRIIGGGTPSRENPDYWGGTIPWVTVKDFATFDPCYTQETITELGLEHSASKLIPAGTLITSTRMALGKAVIYKVDVSINQDLKALFPTEKLRARFLYYWFNYYSRMIDDFGGGSTVKGLSIADLENLEIFLPSLEEQDSITEAFSSMDHEIAALERRRDKTKAIKQGMIQALLTGRIRLVKPGAQE